MDAADAEIVAGLLAGDARAFARAYAAYQGRLYAFLLRLSGRRDVAEDLAHDTWVKLARSASRLRPDTVLLSWLVTVARNEYVSFRRWSVLDVTRLLSLWAATRADDVSISGQPEASLRLGELARAIDTLPYEARETLLLVTVLGTDQEEAAKVLGISHAALRQRLSRARAELERKMERPTGRVRATPKPERGGVT